MSFLLYADKNRLYRKDWEPVTSGSVNVYAVRYQFSADWDGLTKTAVFRAEGTLVEVPMDEDNGCIIPREVLTKHGIKLYAGVYGTRGADTVLPTIWLFLGEVLEGAEPSGEPSRPPPDQPNPPQSVTAYEFGHGLKVTGNTVSVDAANDFEGDNTLPITAAVDGIENRGAISATVQEGDTYTIPKGYHNGSGTVSGVAGGGNYSLQSKAVTPTKNQQNITPDSGYYGLSDVTVAQIPEAYQDVSSTTAGALDVLTEEIYVNAEGKVMAGSMPNNGDMAATIDGLTVVSAAIPAGYYSGGSVSLTDDIETALAAI